MRIRDRLRGDLRGLFSLAVPVTISRVGIMGLALVDTVMVGQYGGNELAYLAVGQVPSNIFILLLMGLLLGTMVLSSNYFGAGKPSRAGEVWWRSLPYAFFWGVVGLLFCAQGEAMLRATGQAEEVAIGGGRYALIVGLSLPLTALNMTSGFFLEGIRRVLPGMIIMLGANVVNGCANYVFVYGNFGMPAMGAEGAAWATFATRVVQLIVTLLYIFNMRDHAAYGVRRPPKASWRAGRDMRNIGYAAGVSLGLENLGFQSLAIFAGLIGTYVAAAHIITINIFAVYFMLGLGISTAAGVRVGNAYGAGDMRAVSYFAWLGFAVQVSIMTFCTLIMFLTAAPTAKLFAEDPQVVGLAAALIAYASVALVLDTGQTLMSQVCRARGDAWVPAFGHIFSYGVVMVPFTYWSVFILERGAYGLVDGIVIGSVVSLVVMGGRFLFLDRYRRVARVFD